MTEKSALRNGNKNNGYALLSSAGILRLHNPSLRNPSHALHLRDPSPVQSSRSGSIDGFATDCVAGIAADPPQQLAGTKTKIREWQPSIAFALLVVMCYANVYHLHLSLYHSSNPAFWGFSVQTMSAGDPVKVKEGGDHEANKQAGGAELETGVSPSVVDIGYLFNGASIFRETAMSFKPRTTDKVKGHEYEIMYGKNLLPYYWKNPKMKMLEIGLGCHQSYGAGASVGLWQALFPEAELWEAEFDAACVKKHKDTSLAGLQTLVGDQGDPEVLDRWIEESGGDFDVVIDDGGHQNCMIWTSFQKLWPTVKRGGLYFIEDMHVAKMPSYRKSTKTCDGTELTVPDKLKEMLDRLIYEGARTGDIEFLFCQTEACVLQKRL